MGIDIEIARPHLGAIMFARHFGAFPGGDVHEIFAIAKAYGMPEHEINYSCSGCLTHALNLIYDRINEAYPQIINDYKLINNIK